MADNVTLPSGTLATNDIGGVQYPRHKSGWGAAGAFNDTSAANPMPTTDAAVAASLATLVTQGAATTPVTVAGNEAVDAALTSNPVPVGGRASTATPSAVSADGDVAPFWVRRTGAFVAELIAGTAIVGKVGIDQTTPGTTDSISIATAQGAGAAIGATSGAKVVTDANGTLQQYLRGLVTFWANALGVGTAATASRVVTATDDTIHGALTETAPTTDIASSGLNGRLQRIAQRLTVLISPGLSASATFTPAASSHTANDCNGAAGTFALAAISAGRVLITSVTLEIDGVSAEATAWRLYLYNVTPPSAIADDGAWTYADADRSAFCGYIDIGTAIDYGPNQWVEVQGVNKQIKLSGTNVFGYLVDLTTLTPAAVAHIVTIHAVQL